MNQERSEQFGARKKSMMQTMQNFLHWSYESEDVTRLLDARRLDDHHFTDKAIKSAATKNDMIADSLNNGFLALPKGGYGVALQDNEIAVIYATLPAERATVS